MSDVRPSTQIDQGAAPVHSGGWGRHFLVQYSHLKWYDNKTQISDSTTSGWVGGSRYTIDRSAVGARFRCRVEVDEYVSNNRLAAQN